MQKERREGAGVFLFAHKLLGAQLITLNATKFNFVVTYQSSQSG